ncbi:unnamed protein product [Ectocarpus sp. 12 AP-2014]
MAFTDREALIALFRSTGGAGWRRRGNWGTDAELATWNGVEVNGHGRVVKLDLTRNNLQGAIPAQIGALTKLTWLDLSSNELDGHIPPLLGNLGALQNLSLNDNKLDGQIPPQLGDVSSLESLDLSRNKLNGPIPPELGNLSALLNLGLGNNWLSGELWSVVWFCIIFPDESHQRRWSLETFKSPRNYCSSATSSQVRLRVFCLSFQFLRNSRMSL